MSFQRGWGDVGERFIYRGDFEYFIAVFADAHFLGIDKCSFVAVGCFASLFPFFSS
jgi:hypothetical protein